MVDYDADSGEEPQAGVGALLEGLRVSKLLGFIGFNECRSGYFSGTESLSPTPETILNTEIPKLTLIPKPENPQTNPYPYNLKIPKLTPIYRIP